MVVTLNTKLVFPSYACTFCLVMITQLICYIHYSSDSHYRFRNLEAGKQERASWNLGLLGRDS